MYTYSKNYYSYTDHNMNNYLTNPSKFRSNDEESEDMSINSNENFFSDSISIEPINTINDNFPSANINTNFDPFKFHNFDNFIEQKGELDLDKELSQKPTEKSTIDNQIITVKKDEMILENQEKNEKPKDNEIKDEENICSNDMEPKKIDKNGNKIFEVTYPEKKEADEKSSNDMEPKKIDKNENKNCEETYPEKKEADEKENLIIKEETKYDFDFSKNKRIKRTRFLKRRRRFENQDNMRKKFKCRFINDFIFRSINNILKEGKKCHKSFERFPQNFVSDVTRKTNKLIIHMTLRQIIQKKEYYSLKNFKNYEHNMKILESEKSVNLEKFLDTEYCDLFDQYINSDAFKIDEINRLKKKNMSDWYINNYINISNHFIEFFEE